VKKRLMVSVGAVLVSIVGHIGAVKPPATPPKPVGMAERVRAEILHSWRGYERDAWGHDELRPVTKTAHDWHGEPLLVTPVDALENRQGKRRGLESRRDRHARIWSLERWPA
jgi:hypothetical protein